MQEPKDKLIALRKSKRLKIKDVHNKLIEVFGKKALSYRTLLRAEKGQHEERDSSLYQLCVGLGISLEELTKGLEEKVIADASAIKFNRRKDTCIYNERVFSEILTPQRRKTQIHEMTLKSKGKTKSEKDSKDKDIHEKWIYVTKGKINCVIEDKTFELLRGDCISFDSTFEHYLENKAAKKSRCIIVHNPVKSI